MSTLSCRKAARATLTLIPLLGVQYLLFPLRPGDDSVLLGVYLITSAIVTSFQVIRHLIYVNYSNKGNIFHEIGTYQLRPLC